MKIISAFITVVLALLLKASLCRRVKITHMNPKNPNKNFL